MAQPVALRIAHHRVVVGIGGGDRHHPVGIGLVRGDEILRQPVKLRCGNLERFLARRDVGVEIVADLRDLLLQPLDLAARAFVE